MTIICLCNSQINNNHNFNIVKHSRFSSIVYIIFEQPKYTNIRKILKRVPYWKKYSVLHKVLFFSYD